MEKWLSKLKGENNKKQIENIVIFIVLLIIIIIVINSLFVEEEVVDKGREVIAVSTNTSGLDDMERRLKNILSHINGVGSVDVMISYSNTIENVPMYDMRENTTVIEEVDSSGGTRKTSEIENEQNIIYEEKNSAKTPAIKETIMPEIIGVIVVAEGASNSVVKENIKNAVGAVFDIPSHRIQVFSK